MVGVVIMPQVVMVILLLLVINNKLILQWLKGSPAHEGATVTFPITLSKFFQIVMGEQVNANSTGALYAREIWIQNVTTSTVTYYSSASGIKRFICIGS